MAGETLFFGVAAAEGFFCAEVGAFFGGVVDTAATAGVLSEVGVADLVLRMDCTNLSAVLSVVLMPVPRL